MHGGGDHTGIKEAMAAWAGNEPGVVPVCEAGCCNVSEFQEMLKLCACEFAATVAMGDCVVHGGLIVAALPEHAVDSRDTDEHAKL